MSVPLTFFYELNVHVWNVYFPKPQHWHSILIHKNVNTVKINFWNLTLLMFVTSGNNHNANALKIVKIEW